MRIYILDYCVNNALGINKEEVYSKFLFSHNSHKSVEQEIIGGKKTPVFKVQKELPLIPKKFEGHNTRNNQLILAALKNIHHHIESLINEYGPSKIGVVFGTSTSGIAEGINALKNKKCDMLPKDYNYYNQQMSSPSDFISDYYNLEGISYTISTACSSGARSIIEGVDLIKNGLCEAVIVGASDSINELTLNGFNSLEALSNTRTNPFSRNRNGINIGEGAAIFILVKTPCKLEILGTGQSSDAFHPSSPDPKGKGAIKAMRMALENANLVPGQIDYINLHGTGTIKNDEMEAIAIINLFAEHRPFVSSSKPFIGHTLGAAGAQELAICALIFHENNTLLPPHVYDEEQEEKFSSLNFVKEGQHHNTKVCMSNSYAFGGNNTSLIIGVNRGNN